MTKLDELFEKKYGAIRGGQTKLARDLGADQSTISSWIKGRTIPSKDFLKKMAKLFSVSEGEVLSAFGHTNYFFNSQAMIGSSGNHNSVGNSATAKDLELMNAKIEVIQKMLENLDLRLKILEKK